MDFIPQWYAVTFGAIVGVGIVAFIIYPAVRRLSRIFMYFFLKYLYYPRLPQFLRDKSDARLFDAMLLFLFLVVNVICSTVGVHNLSQAIRRTGLMTVVNIVPLAMGGHMNILVDRCRIGLRTYQRLHRWIGRVVILQGLAHSTIALFSEGLNWHNTYSVVAIVAAMTLFAMLPTSLGFFMHRFYEVFSKVHLLLVLILASTLVIHVALHNRRRDSLVYLLVAVGTWVLTRIARLANILLHNSRRRGRATEASVIKMPGALLVCVKLSRPWDFRPGQYAYISFPGLKLYEVFRSHPFFIAWWHRSNDSIEDGDDLETVPPDTAVFVIQCNGDAVNDGTELTKRGLKLREEPCLCFDTQSASKMKVLIEGPYGKTLNIGSYGTVVMLATGIGIAAQMPYIKQLLKDQSVVETRRVALYWEIEAEIDGVWVHRWMDELLKAVKRKNMLDIRIFVLGGYKTPGAVQGSSGTKGNFNHMEVSFHAMDAETMINNEIYNVHGNLTDIENPKGTTSKNRNDGIVITTCVNRKMANRVRAFVSTNMDKAIQLEELDFYPQYTGRDSL